MSDFMSMLHKTFFLRAFAASRGVERSKLESKLKALHHKRSLIIYGVDHVAHYVQLSVVPDGPEATHFLLTFEFVDEPANLFYTAIPISTDGSFRESATNVVIVAMDFRDSTESLLSRGTLATIKDNILFHRSIINLIRSKFYPFVYLHEVIGDSFIVALNAEWTYTSELFCATLAIDFVEEVVRRTRSFVSVRAGISFGKIHYGTIGSTFRFFGSPMNMAARLESKCAFDEINLCAAVYDKLVKEVAYLSIDADLSSVVKRTAELKGFGARDYFASPIKAEPFIKYREASSARLARLSSHHSLPLTIVAAKTEQSLPPSGAQMP